MNRCRLNRRTVAVLIAFTGLFVPEAVLGESTRRVEVRVTSVSGLSLYLDKGREAGLEEGDVVSLVIPGQGPVQIRIQSVSRSSARCIAPAGNVLVDIGMAGFVFVPEERFAAPDEPKSDRSPPAPDPEGREHPPWSQSLEGIDEDTPLLAPIIARDPEERPTEYRGRLYTQYLHNINLFYDNNQYSIGRAGLELWVDNPFSWGGGFHFDGGLALRAYDVYGEGQDFVFQGWPTQLSYFHGGTENQPLRYEFGRFFHREFPEFGLLDGTEFIYRNARGDRMGFSFGYLPEPFPFLGTGRDLQTSVFYRFVRDESEDLLAGIGFQKTWHDGIPDRDLLIGNLAWNPSPRFTLNGSAWVDFYTSADTVKNTPLQLTEGLLNAIFRADPAWGVGGHVSYFRWPETLRHLYRPISDAYLLRNEVLRVGAQAWKSLGDHVRFDMRVDPWMDQDDQGIAWDVAMTLSDWPLKQYQLILGVYDTDGLYSSGPGGRVTLMRFFSKGFASIGFDSGGFLYNPSSVLFQQQAVHLALDLSLNSTTSLSFTGDYRFGTSQEALSGGVFLQKRF